MTIPLPVAGLIGMFAGPAVTIERRTVPTIGPSGVVVDGVASVIAIASCAVHTVTGRDLLALPEADRSKDVRRFYSAAQIHTADGGTYAADVLTYQGGRYKATLVHDYDATGGVWIVDAVRLVL